LSTVIFVVKEEMFSELNVVVCSTNEHVPLGILEEETLVV